MAFFVIGKTIQKNRLHTQKDAEMSIAKYARKTPLDFHTITRRKVPDRLSVFVVQIAMIFAAVRIEKATHTGNFFAFVPKINFHMIRSPFHFFGLITVKTHKQKAACALWLLLKAVCGFVVLLLFVIVENNNFIT